jgi:flagellum-specific ATP synthase
MRAILDGHVVLSRDLAQQAHFPAVDVLRSNSRLFAELVPANEQELVAQAVRHLAVLDRNRQLVELGAYTKGANPALDAALALEAPLSALLRQDDGGVSRRDAMQQLAGLLQREGKS